MRSLRFFVLWSVSVLLMALAMQVLTAGIAQRSVMAATPGNDVVLKYDDEVPVKFQTHGCPVCSRYQGVFFSLPDGVPSAVVTAVTFYYKSPSYPTTPEIFIMKADQKTYLTYAIPLEVKATGWQTLTFNSPVLVCDDFWVVVKWNTKDASVAMDSANDANRSFMGDNLNEINKKMDGDLMTRATIRPEVHVGVGQEFATIQAAIDAVRPDVSIVVHEGQYLENVRVYKRLPIRSLDGPSVTTVTPADPAGDAFLITANGSSISGFTILDPDGIEGAGINIDEASGCTISGNVIQDSYYGIYLSEGSTNNILLENECKFNSNGIYVDGSQNYLSGNKLHGNTAPLGSAVFLSGTASGNMLRFNSITVDAGMEPAVANRPQVYNQNSTAETSAIENWWGSENAPANMTMVLSDPCLTKPPVRVKTAFTSAGEFTVDAQSETSATVIKQGDGTPVVSVASFAENPAGDFKGKSLGKWVDVLLSSSDSIDQVEIRVSYTADEIQGLKEGSLKLFWWNGQKWKVCSKTGVDKAGDFVWARLDAKSKPGPGDLSGTMFAVGSSNGSAGFQWWVIPLVILIVILLLIVFRLVWVLLIKGERM